MTKTNSKSVFFDHKELAFVASLLMRYGATIPRSIAIREVRENKTPGVLDKLVGSGVLRAGLNNGVPEYTLTPKARAEAREYNLTNKQLIK